MAITIGENDISSNFNIPADIDITDVYNETLGKRGGKLYYTHNRAGTEWFDSVDNSKGWTVDFGLNVVKIENNISVMSDEKTKGIGVYVNDGERKETISFLSQEIIFENAKVSTTFDTTEDIDYRLIGKGDRLRLFAKRDGEDYYKPISDVSFLSKSSKMANGLKPSITEDSAGNLHTVWYDDGNGYGQIFYSMKPADGEYGEQYDWTEPEIISDQETSSQFPQIISDGDNKVYVTYETKKTNNTSIAVRCKTTDWGNEVIISGFDGDSKKPKMVLDYLNNVFVVWEDYRTIQPEIYICKFNKAEQKWAIPLKISSSTYGAFNPSITIMLDDVYVSYTNKTVSTSTIKIVKLSAITMSVSLSVTASVNLSQSGYSSILALSSGRILCVWHDLTNGQFFIYGTVLSPYFSVLTSVTKIGENSNNGGSKYPVLSEQKNTGDIYIVWEDYMSDYSEFNSLDIDNPYDEQADPTQEKPLLSAIFSLKYNILTNTFDATPTDTITVFSNRNSNHPNVPNKFSLESGLPIVYERKDYNDFLSNNNIYTNIGCIFYGTDFSPYADSDYLVSKTEYRKEIRFGDFSDNLNAHFIFKYFKYYTNDAVEPFSLIELSAQSFDLAGFNAKDIAVNNYGDVWIVGTCGMFYYINKSNFLAIVDKPNTDPNIEWSNGDSTDNGDLNFNSIVFDAHNFMFIGKKSGGVWYSTEHIGCYKQLSTGSGSETATITSINFDKDNVIFIGTDANSSDGLKIGTISESEGTISYTSKNITIPTDLISSYVTCIVTDNNNATWIGTKEKGLYRFYKNRFTNISTSDGLPSMIVNDIAIRNTAIRYVATSNGIAKMSGNTIDDIIRTDNSEIYNNNVKCVLWQEPNILWAGTLSQINQITVNDSDNTYSSVLYEPNPSYSIEKDDLQTFYIISSKAINTKDIVEVYVNGNYVSAGYKIGYDQTVSKMVLRFDTPLLHSDIVEINVRKDLELKNSFVQEADEQSAIGVNLIRIKELHTSGASLYMISEGNENEIKINDSTSQLPFDKVFLDTNPPTADPIVITPADRIDQTTFSININNVVDVSASEPPTEGSGVDRMIISNYSNFTTDGITPQNPVPFRSPMNHNLNVDLTDTVYQYNFEGSFGSKIECVDVDKQELFAASYLDGNIYKYNFTIDVWEKQLSEPFSGCYIDFITKYNGQLIVGVGRPESVSQISIFDIHYENGTFQSLDFVKSLSLNESRAFCCLKLNNKLYIGCGRGSHENGVAPNGGTIYVYNGVISPVEVVSGLDNNVYALTDIGGSDKIFAATGSDTNGHVYEINVLTESAAITYSDTEPIISIEYIKFNNSNLIFTGGFTNGIIRRSSNNSNSFGISFRTTPSKISCLKTFNINSKDTIFAAIGNTLYYFSESATWTWKYSHNQVINDFTYVDNDFYIISDEKITKLNPAAETKNIYVKLIDRAGNESETIFGSITIADLSNFVYENTILELDELGNTISTFGNLLSPFYSANKIEIERGIYDSEIFDGTNNLVKWDEIRWTSTKPYGTDILIYLRSSASKNDILLSPWVGPFTNSIGTGISSFGGRYLQFRAELTSTIKDISPLLHNVVIKSVLSEAVHFFTTNFSLPSRMIRGIITSNKTVPLSADIVFGINTTNSINWHDYQIVEENRLFNINQLGENIRVGIKFITPTRMNDEQMSGPGSYPNYSDPYDPYYTDPYYTGLFVNTISFNYTNGLSYPSFYHFKVSFYSDYNMENLVYSYFSYTNPEGFSIENTKLTTSGCSIDSGDSKDILFAVPSSSRITCGTYYFVKIESTNLPTTNNFETISSGYCYIKECQTSFINDINFDFKNESTTKSFSYRISFCSDQERTEDIFVKYSGNDSVGWAVNGSSMTTGSTTINNNEIVSIVYSPDLTEFDPSTVYYLKIDYLPDDSSDFVNISNSYTWKTGDIISDEYCGNYQDVPIVSGFGILLELDNNEFVTLNI